MAEGEQSVGVISRELVDGEEGRTLRDTIQFGHSLGIWKDVEATEPPVSNSAQVRFTLTGPEKDLDQVNQLTRLQMETSARVTTGNPGFRRIINDAIRKAFVTGFKMESKAPPLKEEPQK